MHVGCDRVTHSGNLGGAVEGDEYRAMKMTRQTDDRRMRRGWEVRRRVFRERQIYVLLLGERGGGEGGGALEA